MKKAESFVIARTGFESKVLAAFVAAVLVVAALAGTAWLMARDAADAERWVAHTHEVLNSLAQTRAHTLQVELSTQNYRLYGDPARLAEHDAAVADREALMLRLKKLTKDNQSQQERWAQLRRVIDERIAISVRVIQLRQTQGSEAARAYAAGAPLQQTRDRMHQLLRAMDGEEQRLLEERLAERRRAHRMSVAGSALVALLLTGLLTATYFLIRRQLRQTEAGRRALAESQERLSITLNSIGDAVLATDTAGRITRMNPVAEWLTGWRLAEAQGRPVGDVFRIVDEHTRAPLQAPVEKVLASGATQSLADRSALIGRDGSEHPIADSAAPIRDASGSVSGVVLVFRDETAARRAQRMIREQNELLEQRVRERTAQLRESEEHLRSVISNVPAMIAFVDVQQRYVYVNRQYLERFAPDQGEIAGRTVREILGEERYTIAGPIITNALQGQPQSYDWQPFPGVWQVINYVPRRDPQQRVIGYYVLGTDITERKHAEEKIQSLNAELARHLGELEHVSRGLRTLSAGNRAMLRARDEQDLLDSMCRAIVESGGYRMASVWYRIDDEFRSLRPVAQYGHAGGLEALEAMQSSWGDDEFGRDAAGSAVRSGQPSVVRNILTDPAYAPWRRHLPGCACGLASPLRVDGAIAGSLAIYAGEPDGFSADEVVLLSESADDLAFGIATLRTRAAQQKIQEAMRRMTMHDALTGMPNEVQFTEFLSAAIAAATRNNRSFAALQANIERLGEINDTLGFNHGDQILRDFCARLSTALPSGAAAARLRGDEFAILLPDSGIDGAVALARRLENALAEPFSIADISLDVSAKIGVTLFPAHGATPHDLFRHMDIAVQQAKKQGVGHAVFERSLSRAQPDRLAMVGELRRAIEGGELRLHLQPKLDMRSGRACGAEGLVRWQHAARGLIQPNEFIGLAERTGLIKPLTEWVIETALRLARRAALDGCALPIAVNLSARNLRDENLLKRIRKLRKRLGIAAGTLEMEITESMVMDDAEFALRVLGSLRDDGIPLYIDDFGTGYSSLSYLQKLPVEYIKIDRSFVHDMLLSRDSAAIVRSTIDLAHDLGRKVVAEGVETQAHWDQLAAFGCDIAQGYFIAKPMPAEELPGWVKQSRERWALGTGK